ncbi:MAG: hypothetical protein Q7R79_03350 [bacterium]|nr:hypothetical protein [bacterium]
MKISLWVLATALVTISSNGAHGRNQTNSWTPNGSLSLSLQERYIGIRVSRVFHNGVSLWSDLNVNLPKGFYVNIWNHYGVDGRETSKQPNELDLTLGWRGDLPRVGLEVGFATTYINNSPLGLWWERDVWAQSATFSKTYTFGQHTLRPQLRVDWLSRTTDFGGGALVLMPNVSHTWKRLFGIEPLNFIHQVFVIHDDGFYVPKNDSEGYFLRWNAGLRWRLSKKTTITLPSFIAQVPLHRGGDGRGQTTSWGSSLSFSF